MPDENFTPLIEAPECDRGRCVSVNVSLNTVHFLQAIWTALAAFGTLPDTLDAGAGRIAGTAFFPGGDGLVQPRSTERTPDVMIVGHDFGTLAYFDRCVAQGEERITQPTWRGILARLEAAGIDRQRCFFTNAFVGFRKEGGNTDAFPARNDDDYIRRCRELLALQIGVLRPRAIIALGTFVPSYLAAISPDIDRWSATRDFTAIDRAGPLVRNAAFGSHHATVAALVHPSYERLNVGRRRYTPADGVERIGTDAEIALLRDATAS